MTAVEEVKNSGSYHYSEVAAAMVVDALGELTAQIGRVADALEGLDATESRARALEAWRNGHGKHPDD